MRLGKPIHHYESVDSTQDAARDLLRQGALPGTVVSAGYQTQGRGRQCRPWFQKPGANVCMTVIGPSVPIGAAWQLSLLVGVGVTEGITLVSVARPHVRFPNDIYLNGQKLGGILIETIPSERKEWVVPLVGIGININIDTEEFPQDLQGKATSLLHATGHEHLVSLVRTAVLSRLEAHWLTFAEGGWESVILPRWNQLRDEDAERVYILDNKTVRCRVLQLQPDGTVTLESNDGKRTTLHAAQVILGDS